jgi:glycosyltransferase involved in cell wall biosynthesis
MREFYNVANIILLHSRCEAFGRVVLEAFAHGVPVVAKGCGGPSEIIKHGKTGLLFSTGTAVS